MPFLSLDRRALAVMRMAVAAVIMADLAIRWSDLEAFYANSGVAPLSMIFEKNWNQYYISLHAISGLWQVQALLFFAAFIFAIFLFLGYRTQLFTFLSWFMLLSLHNRNGFVMQGGDDLLRMTLFWAMFLPWGDRYSCDTIFLRRIVNENEIPQTILSIASVAYVLQICYIYSGSALLKGPEWHTDFTAMYYVYGLDQIAYPVTRYLFFYHPGFLKILTGVAWYFELLVPLFFFFPFAHQRFRLTGVFLICLFHIFNTLTLLIGLFPFIG